MHNGRIVRQCERPKRGPRTLCQHILAFNPVGIAGLAGNSQLGAGAQIKLKSRVSAGLRDGVKVANGHEFSSAVGYCGERMAHDGIANRPCQSVGRTENASASPDYYFSKL